MSANRLTGLRRAFVCLVLLVAIVNSLIVMSFSHDLHPAYTEAPHRCAKYEDWFDVPGWYPTAWVDDPVCADKYYEESTALVTAMWLPVAAGAIAAWSAYGEYVTWRQRRRAEAMNSA